MDTYSVNTLIFDTDARCPFEIIIFISKLELDLTNCIRSVGEFIDPFILQWQMAHIVEIGQMNITFEYVTVQVFFNIYQFPDVIHEGSWPIFYLGKRLGGPWWDLILQPDFCLPVSRRDPIMSGYVSSR
ncbi:uncharacterized protein N7459_005818 [Penicillium hispanicum]|uniref:uncharacterized protein n=1 Tax=Penicillium hispanicum TaxID=1080232 RepID=UPI002541CD22|nr:uncharacterized protein N7459_005818 [Penicillium hispanicum]KAJ5579833.1 hypothetical protein N7459_005818 [Penicillium hispanicum]